MKRGYFFAVVLLGACCASVGAEQLSIVRDGRSEYAISIPDDATPGQHLAASELATYVKQMTRIELEIKKGTPVPEHAILLVQVDRLPDSRRFPMSAGPEDAYRIRVEGNHLSIEGNSDRALLFGVYRLLDEWGCRFLAPQFGHYQGSAELIPRTQSLSFGDSVIEASPKLKFRKLYIEEGHSHTMENLKQLIEWMPKVGYNTLVVPTDYQGTGRVKWDNWRAALTPELQKRGITIEVGGHGYQNFLNAGMSASDGRNLFEAHPEWFGADKQGKRQRGKEWVLCTSNDDAVKFLIDNFLAYVKARPEIQIYDFWPPDGAKRCECENCAKLGTPSDRQARLLGQVQQRLKEVRPDLRLEMIAYASYLAPPEQLSVDKNVLVDFCPINQQFDRAINDPAGEKNKMYADALLAWRHAFEGDISIYSYYRKYAWDSLPVILPHYMQKDLQWYAGVPTQGVSTYSEPGDWFTYELNHYVLAALAWDPDADVDALVKKFCEARYGSFADQAATALITLEDITRNTCSIPNTPLQSADKIQADGGRATKMAQGIAADATRASDPAVKRNLERLALMCEFAQRDLEIQRLRATRADREQIRQKATELHEFLQQHADEGVFLVDRISVRHLLSKYGAN